MPSRKLALLAVLVGLIGACGGRSTLKAGLGDGGAEADVAVALDGKRDVVPGADAARDGSSDRPADAATRSDATDGVIQGDARADVPTPNDVAGRDVATREARGEAGGTDAPPALLRLELAPATLTIAVGVPYGGFVATAVYADGSTVDVTAQATLVAADSSIAQVAALNVTGKKAGSTEIKATWAGMAATAALTVTAAALQSITIDGVAPVAVGQFILVSATGIFADGTKQDVTVQAAWTTSDPALATVAVDSATGKAKLSGVKAGTLSIAATLSGVTGKAEVRVTSATMTRVEVTPAQPILQQGVSRRFQATASYSDGATADVTTQATWASSSPGVATVTADTTGAIVKAVATGSATISATVGTLKGSTLVTVTAPALQSIALSPATWSPNVGAQQAFTATATYADGSTADVTLSATWTSSNTAVVSVSNAAGGKGSATALAAGSAQIQAALGTVTASAAVTVSASPLTSIVITPNPVAVVLGLESALVATGIYGNGTTQVLTGQVAWSIGDPAVATISNGGAKAGHVTGVAPGTTVAYAALGSIVGKTIVNVAKATLTAITVSPATASVTAGVAQAFTATATYDNGSAPDVTTQVAWQSSDVAVAQVSNAAGSQGLAATLTAGTATITATLGGLTGSATLTVGEPRLASLTISPTTASVLVGNTRTFTALAVYQNGTTAAVAGTWSSSNPAVATVTAEGRRAGVATGVAAGQTTIAVSYQGMSASAALTVTESATVVALTITPANPTSLLVGGTQQLQANAVASDGSTTSVTGSASWTTSDPGVVTVANGGAGLPAGRASGTGAGTATITATYDGLTASVTINVRDPALIGLAITPVAATVKVNGTQQFAAVASYEDGTTATVTGTASWTTSDGAIASITTGGGRPGGGGGRGLATGLAVGAVTVTATYSGLSATASLTVSAATATSLVVTPAAVTLQVGQTQAFVATVIYSDSTTAVVTTGATWTSSDPAVATVSTASRPGGRAGDVTAVAVGSASIGASYAGLTGSAILSVTDPELVYVQVTPTQPSIPVQATSQFTATAVFADNSTRDVTAQAAWSSSNAEIAVVGDSGPNRGRASALAEGSATITASYGGLSGSSVLSVAGSVVSVSVTPVNPTTVPGLPVAFTATALLSNAATMVVTNGAAWVSSAPTVATVTAAGMATPIAAGTSAISATYLGKSGASVLTVSAAALVSIAITPSSVTVAPGGSVQLSATGTYDDGKTFDLTNVATWLSSGSAATVSNAAGSRGLVTGVGPATVSVTAVFQGKTSTATAVVVK